MRCTSCGASIQRVPTAASQGRKRMPLNADERGYALPDNSGNVTLLENGHALVIGGPLLPRAQEDESVTLYMPHWATCPTAEKHREPPQGTLL